MNCKPGELAVIVHVDSDDFLPNLGRLVEVLFPFASDRGPSWVVRVIGRPACTTGGAKVQEGLSLDRNMRPIRDPGDDATDETLVPGYVKETV